VSFSEPELADRMVEALLEKIQQAPVSTMKLQDAARSCGDTGLSGPCSSRVLTWKASG